MTRDVNSCALVRACAACLLTTFTRALMNVTIRQKTGTVDSACLTMLALVSITLLGFSTPPHARGTNNSVPLVEFEQSEALANGPLNAPGSDWVEIGINPTNSTVIPRPVSLAAGEPIQAVLGDIDAHYWLQPTDYSPHRALTNQRDVLVGEFHGVGFPDIRTYYRAKPSPFDAPGPWAPLVTWRALEGQDSLVEPIARVWCMGLSPHAVARRADRYLDMIYDYADRYAVSPHLIKAVISVESCFNNKALSPVGAQGLMQLMPDTAHWLKVKDPHDPAQNLRGGVKYLAALQKEFDTTELALAAYNAGPGNVRRYNGVPPFAETLAYVVKVQAHYRRYKAAHSLLYPTEDTFDQASNLLISE